MTAPVCPQALDVNECGFCGAPAPAYSLTLMRPKSARAEDADMVGMRACAACARSHGSTLLRLMLDWLHATADSKGSA